MMKLTTAARTITAATAGAVASYASTYYTNKFMITRTLNSIDPINSENDEQTLRDLVNGVNEAGAVAVLAGVGGGGVAYVLADAAWEDAEQAIRKYKINKRLKKMTKN